MPRKRSSAKTDGSKRPTIHDVARDADVSIYTVSRTLNNLPGVNPITRERVLEVCRRLGMRSRPAARSKQFALIMPNREAFSNSSYIPLLTFELQMELSSRGMGLTLFNSQQMLDLSRQLFDGIFVATWDEQALSQLTEIESTPVVVVNRFSLAGQYHVVGWDHHAEGRTVAEYLHSMGHRRLGMIAEPPAHLHSTQSRLAGFCEYSTEVGHPIDPSLIELLETRSNLVAALSRMLAQKVEAIYIPAQGRLGPEALQILQGVLKVKVPEQVSLLTGEHAHWSSLFDPPLTTVDAPMALLAQHSVDHMLKLVEQKPTEPTEVLIATPIIPRKSVLNRNFVLTNDARKAILAT